MARVAVITRIPHPASCLLPSAFFLLPSAFLLPPSAFRLSMSSPVRPDPATPLPPDPDARPRSLAQRLGLLLILLVLPVPPSRCPTLVVTHIFGQRPRPKTDAPPTPAPADTTGLRQELDRRANGLLPTPAPLTAEPIRVSVRDPSHVGPRAEKVKAQAQGVRRLGGRGLGGRGRETSLRRSARGRGGRLPPAVRRIHPVELLTAASPPSISAGGARSGGSLHPRGGRR